MALAAWSLYSTNGREIEVSFTLFTVETTIREAVAFSYLAGFLTAVLLVLIWSIARAVKARGKQTEGAASGS